VKPAQSKTFDQTWIVSHLLEVYPQASQVFFRLKTDCVGCILSRFCTLLEVAKAYDLDLDQMMGLLSQSVDLSKSKEETYEE
jgi:hypothetical protein